MSLARAPRSIKHKSKPKTRVGLSSTNRKVLKAGVSLKSQKSLKKLKTKVKVQSAVTDLQTEVLQQYQEQHHSGAHQSSGSGSQGQTGQRQGQSDFGNNEQLFHHLEDIFQQEGLDITVLDEEEMADDYDDLKRLFGGKIPWSAIAQLYKQKLQTIVHLSKTTQNKQTMQVDHRHERKQSINDALFDILEEKQQEETDILKFLINNLTLLQHFFKKFAKLHPQQQHKLLQLLKKILQTYKEGKIIEIYELQINDDGTIVIKTSAGSDAPQDTSHKTISISLKQIGTKNQQKVKKFLEKRI